MSKRKEKKKNKEAERLLTLLDTAACQRHPPFDSAIYQFDKEEEKKDEWPRKDDLFTVQLGGFLANINTNAQ